MIQSKHLTFVIPCYNESMLIRKTVETMPQFVDTIILVDDCSTDGTLAVMQQLLREDPRVMVLHNETNQGVGYSVVRGFRAALDTKTDLIGVIAGDAQCDPSRIEPMAQALLRGQLDYVKGNRFADKRALRNMPLFRRMGNFVVTYLTKAATGYWHIFDSQTGYGIFRRETLERIDLGAIGKRYDYESTLLIELAIARCKIKDVPVPAIYGDETSHIPVLQTAVHTLGVLWQGYWKRMRH